MRLGESGHTVAGKNPYLLLEYSLYYLSLSSHLIKFDGKITVFTILTPSELHSEFLECVCWGIVGGCHSRALEFLPTVRGKIGSTRVCRISAQQFSIRRS
jgi:hypothetical protein